MKRPQLWVTQGQPRAGGYNRRREERGALDARPGAEGGGEIKAMGTAGHAGLGTTRLAERPRESVRGFWGWLYVWRGLEGVVALGAGKNSGLLLWLQWSHSRDAGSRHPPESQHAGPAGLGASTNTKAAAGRKRKGEGTWGA